VLVLVLVVAACHRAHAARRERTRGQRLLDRWLGRTNEAEAGAAPEDVAALRAEVRLLRAEVAQLRTARAQPERPPSYAGGKTGPPW
jgi:hypothetical protein